MQSRAKHSKYRALDFPHRIFREEASCSRFTHKMSKRSDASSHDDHESIAVVVVVVEAPGRKKSAFSAPNREDLVPDTSSTPTTSETPITIKVHKEFPRFRFIGRYKFKHEDKFITERVYTSSPTKENNARGPSLRDMFKDVCCSCFF